MKYQEKGEDREEEKEEGRDLGSCKLEGSDTPIFHEHLC